MTQNHPFQAFLISKTYINYIFITYAFFLSVNIGKILRFILGKQIVIWDRTCTSKKTLHKIFMGRALRTQVFFEVLPKVFNQIIFPLLWFKNQNLKSTDHSTNWISKMWFFWDYKIIRPDRFYFFSYSARRHKPK